MTTSPDPDPENTPGLEPGGGVRPGDTPPGESSTHGLSHHEPTPPRWGNAVTIGLTIIVTLAVLVVIIVIVVQMISVV
ncbi:DUF6480 family protein [Streptoalloteichus tenebrarius]|uniref:DUF6480 family protein n=1 Tax=Streptoalloteichus tenebrarius (strain ATCC 17920 / DSM 40477 / JCM 4838 / CBS 697.72 / NBRC 16177 / NCIMB 11028 / NRRL B-12390 / A12253. 1 / ISP 5477) TaxID=1933 RepID=UPI0020A2BAC6|nr:DUF6480 family protein [Streptoalloteichus tenebrarius]BFE99992.1 hypothetical protein GCM10020241_16680 [Streptoalloteichus tenebrarius]